jgi:hypothetical protein
MSGGRYDYAYCKIEDFAFRIKTHGTGCDLERKAFQKLLHKVSQAMKDIEWEDSGDGADTLKSISACFDGKQLRTELLIVATADAKDIHERLGKLLEAANKETKQ